VKLTTHLHLVPRSRNAWSYTPTPPVRIHVVVLYTCVPLRGEKHSSLLHHKRSVANSELRTSLLINSRFSSPPPGPDRLWDSPSFLSSGYHWVLYPGVDWLGRQADSRPSTSEFKNAWSYISTHSHVFITW